MSFGKKERPPDKPFTLSPPHREAMIELMLTTPISSYTPDLLAASIAARTAYLKDLKAGELLEELDSWWSHWAPWRAEACTRFENVMTPPFHWYTAINPAATEQ